MYKGIARDLTNAIKIINESEPSNIKHMCTRAVSNALEGIRNVHQASGVSDPQAMYNLLKKDGWTDVLNDNYVAQAGDVWTYYDNSKKMHTSMFDGEKWISYDVEGRNPWYYENRHNGKGHIQRYIPKAQEGMKFVQYTPLPLPEPRKKKKENSKEENKLDYRRFLLNPKQAQIEAQHEAIEESPIETVQKIPTSYAPTPVGQTLKFFNDNGFGISAYGFVGNFLHESGLNPQAVNKGEAKRTLNYGAGIYQASNERKLNWERKNGGRKFETASLDEQLNYALEEARARPAFMSAMKQIDENYNAGRITKEDAIKQATSAVLLGFENGSANSMLTPTKFNLIYLKNPLNGRSYEQHLATRTKLALGAL